MDNRSPASSFVKKMPVRLGLLWFFIHTTIWISAVKFIPGSSFVPYKDLGSLSTPWIRQFVLPLCLVALFQFVAARKLRLMEISFKEAKPSVKNSLWIWPALMLGAVIYLVSTGLSAGGVSFYAGLVLTCLLVGLTEEMSFRGVLLVLFRESKKKEAFALWLSSILFGLFHLPNILIGGEVSATIRQVFATCVMGMVFYALRRRSGSLVWCILLHAVYDMAVLASVG